MKKTLFLATLTFLMATSAQADDQYCREYTKTIMIGGKAQKGYGTTCLQPDGSWQIATENNNDNNYDDNTNYNTSDDGENYVIRDRRVYIVPAPIFYPQGYYRYDRNPYWRYGFHNSRAYRYYDRGNSRYNRGNDRGHYYGRNHRH